MYILYGLIDPNTNELRYIGKTNNLSVRLRNHYNKINTSKSHKNSWLKSLNRKHAEVYIFEEYENDKDALLAEVDAIAYKFIGCRLTNHTDGGEGPTGHKHSEELKRKISEFQFGKKRKPFTEEHKQNISRAHIGKSRPIEVINKISQSKIGHIVSEETRNKISKARRGNILLEDNIKLWISCYKNEFGKIPNSKSGLIKYCKTENLTWSAVHQCFRYGYRGIYKYGSLFKFINLKGLNGRI